MRHQLFSFVFGFFCVLGCRAPAAQAEIVKFRLVRAIGADSYPEYRVVDAASGAVTEMHASLRCVERGYDGRKTWTYREVMIFDPAGPEIRRKEPRAEVPVERGFRYAFRSFAECETAAPTVLDDSARCEFVVDLNRDRESAKMISAACEEAR